MEFINSWFHRFFTEVVGELPLFHVPALLASCPPVFPCEGPSAVAAEREHYSRMTVVDRELDYPVEQAYHPRSHDISELHLRPSDPASGPLVPEKDGAREAAQSLLAVQVVDFHVCRAALGRLHLTDNHVSHRRSPLLHERVETNLHVLRVSHDLSHEQGLYR